MSVDDKSMEDATAAMDIVDHSDPAPNPTVAETENNPHDNNDDDDDDATAEMMDEINDDDDDDDDDESDDKKVAADEPPTCDEAYVCKAIGLKEQGNEQFQKGDYDQAARSYRRGVTALKKVKHQLDDQVKQLKITLYTNWSTVSYKDQKYRVSLDMSTKAVEIDAKNVKALYRRAMAHRKLGSLELARTDLRTALGVEPNNTACRKELISIKKELEDSVAKQKKSFAKAFDSSKNGTSFLYDDKEELAKQREIEEKRRKKEQEELNAKHKKQWEDECVSLMAKNESVLSFEEWDKKRQEKEDEEKKQKEMQRKAKKERIKSTSSSKRDKDDNDDDDDITFTEAELAAMRGYKKTSDGRTTSYFTRELSQEEQMQIGDIAPKRLDTTTTATTTGNGSNSSTMPGLQQLSDVSSSSPTTTTATATATTTTSASVWNQAGTWEEKNTTEWCQSQLKQRLLETMTGNAILSCKITKIDDLNGDASVVAVSGKKRYIFDFNVKCKYQIYDNSQMDRSTSDETDGGSKVVATGTLRLPDICSTHHEEVEVICEPFKKSPPAHFLDSANTIRQMLVENVRMQIGLFVQDFNQMY